MAIKIFAALFISLQQCYLLEGPTNPQQLEKINNKIKSSYEKNIRNRRDLLTKYYPKGSCYVLSISEEKQSALVDTLCMRDIESKQKQLLEKEEVNVVPSVC